jgi:hypothetical protein
MESSVEVSQNNNNKNPELPFDPAIPLLGIYPKKCKSGCNKDTYVLMFIAALFTTAKLWKHYRCPTTDEWIKKSIYVHIQWNLIQL